MAPKAISTHRMCRRLGAPVCGRPNCPALRRPYPPGMHGKKRAPRQSEYQRRLLEKQKVRALLRALYGVAERQLRRYVEAARRSPGEIGENLLILLERRLDNLVRRLGFATTVAQARQLVAHGHVRVDGQRVDRPSYAVRPGQVIEVATADLLHVQEALAQTPEVPTYLDRDPQRWRGTLTRLPRLEEMPHPVAVNDRLVVEYYAR